jgi:hypothetical protein
MTKTLSLSSVGPVRLVGLVGLVGPLAVTIAATAGCAGRAPSSTSVPVMPVAEGVAAASVRYELHVGDALAGVVRVTAGSAEREARHQHIVRLTVGVENRTTDRRFLVPLDELALRDGEGGRAWPKARLVEVDRRAPATGALVVEPGQAQAVTVAFALPPETRVADLDRASLGWTLVVEDPAARDQPVRFARATALITNEAGRVFAPPPGAEENVAYQPSGMLPAAGQRDLRPSSAGALNPGAHGNQPLRAAKEKPAVW